MKNQPERLPLKLLSISQYGGGMASTGAQFSGAAQRQQDYSACLERYDIIVPVERDDLTPVTLNERTTVYPVKAHYIWRFLIEARKKTIELHAAQGYGGFLVDNPHLVGLLGLYLRRKLGIPMVVHSMADSLQNVWYQRERLSNRIKHLIMEFVAKRTDIVRVSTEEELERLGAGPYGKKLMQVPFYVDHAAIKNAAPSEITRDPHKLLFVGRLGYQKDLPFLLSTLVKVKAVHPKVHLTLVGGGPLEAELKRHTAELGLTDTVTFTGPVPYEAVMQHFAEAGLFVIASLYEGTCMVLHEAAVLGVPIVATDFAGAKDIIRDGQTGRLVPIRDGEALAEAIITYIEQPNLAHAAASQLQTEISVRDRSAAVSAWRKLCQRLLEIR